MLDGSLPAGQNDQQTTTTDDWRAGYSEPDWQSCARFLSAFAVATICDAIGAEQYVSRRESRAAREFILSEEFLELLENLGLDRDMVEARLRGLLSGEETLGGEADYRGYRPTAKRQLYSLLAGSAPSDA